jgi:hypothetical protein
VASEDAAGKPGTVGGGRSTRGPEPDPGGGIVPGGLVPPYEGRSTGPDTSESTRANTASVKRQLATTKAGRRGATGARGAEHPADPSKVTDEAPTSAKGVGESLGTRGEDVGRQSEERG